MAKIKQAGVLRVAGALRVAGVLRVSGDDSAPVFSMKDPATGKLTGFDAGQPGLDGSEVLAHALGEHGRNEVTRVGYRRYSVAFPVPARRAISASGASRPCSANTAGGRPHR